MSHLHFIIRSVSAVGNAVLRIRFADGLDVQVDLREVIARHPTLRPLSRPDVFAQVTLDEWHRGVNFAGDDDLALASDNLRALALEQAGHYSHQQVIAWMQHHHLSLDSASDALGISRRMLAYYRSGERPIPKTVGLAMLGWEAQESGHHFEAYDEVA